MILNKHHELFELFDESLLSFPLEVDLELFCQAELKILCGKPSENLLSLRNGMNVIARQPRSRTARNALAAGFTGRTRRQGANDAGVLLATLRSERHSQHCLLRTGQRELPEGRGRQPSQSYPPEGSAATHTENIVWSDAGQFGYVRFYDIKTNPASGPDAPTNFKVVPSTTGLYLTWTASPQDPGCVSGYEISRSESASGIYSVIATTAKSVLKYNDTTANAGITYYYKIRAVSGTDYSPYTSEASGKR